MLYNFCYSITPLPLKLSFLGPPSTSWATGIEARSSSRSKICGDQKEGKYIIGKGWLQGPSLVPFYTRIALKGLFK
jgi:hypothetical protein